MCSCLPSVCLFANVFITITRFYTHNCMTARKFTQLKCDLHFCFKHAFWKMQKKYCTVLYCTVLYCTVLYCTVLYCTVLYCTVLYCTVLYCTVLYCTVLYCTVLYCTVLYCTVLYCTVLFCKCTTLGLFIFTLFS